MYERAALGSWVLIILNTNVNCEPFVNHVCVCAVSLKLSGGVALFAV